MSEKKSLNFDFLDKGPKKADEVINNPPQTEALPKQINPKATDNVPFIKYFKECYTDFSGFSKKYLTEKSPKYFILVLLIFGMGSTADRMIGSIQDYSNWGEVWVVTAVSGLISGAIAYFIAGAFYYWRVKWANGKDDIDTAKHIWLFSSLPIAATSLLSLLTNQIAYGNDYFDGYGTNVDLIFALLSIFAIIYSINISYKAVRAVLKAEKGKAIWWFIVAPTIFYIIIFGISFASAL